jgi:hypothetical protein
MYNQMGYRSSIGGYSGSSRSQMRKSQEQMMRSSGGSTSSNHSNHSHRSHNGLSQGQFAFDSRASGNSAQGGSRDSRSSRGSMDGMRMSGGPEMAGVGIFFQQEPTSGRVYVANIVENGSADRSGVIRVNDVIVKVDDEDVQGQPLSTLRNLILGKQGTYVVLAFRRMTGSELYYFDVELVRGTPEYFEALKKSQAVADEKEKLLFQVRQQEQDIRALRAQTTGSTPSKSPAVEGPLADAESVKRAIASKQEEIMRLEAALERERSQTAPSGGGVEERLPQLRSENKRLGDTLSSETKAYEDLKARLQQQAQEHTEQRQRMQVALQTEISAANSSHTQMSADLDAENAQLRKELDALDQRDKQAQQSLRQAQQVLDEVTKNNQSVVKLLQELVPAVNSAFGSGLFPQHLLVCVHACETNICTHDPASFVQELRPRSYSAFAPSVRRI